MTEPHGPGDDLLWARAAALLAGAEQQIRLLDRVVPQNLGLERQRLALALARGEAATPAFDYAAPPDFSQLSANLEGLARDFARAGALGCLHAERAEELLLELRLVESLGGPGFAALSAERYPAEPSPELDELVREFARAPLTEPGELVRAGDESDPRSLVSVLRARVGALRVPVRVELRRDLHSVAAAGEGLVLVREDARLSARAAERIACHELLAHVLPRLEARRQTLGIYRAGTRQANEDEEGRALCIEQRLGFWDGARLVELARRHRVALAARTGATLNELVGELTSDGVELQAALDLALRALRGGGLARELVYLPAYLRVSRAFAEDPSAERFFERGRVSLASLPALAAAELSR